MLKRMILLATIGLLLCLSGFAFAQTRSVVWQHWDVLIDNIDTANNRFDVTETYDVDFTGTFSFGLRIIALTNLDDIQNIQISDGGQPLRPGCTEQPGTYCVTDTPDGRETKYYFLETVTNDNRIFRIHYTVVGALRIYEGGDQIWWSAIPDDHYGYTIGSSTVTVQLPPGFGPRQGIDPVAVYGVPGNVRVNGTTITAVPDGAIEGDGSFEIRVQYPHDPNATPSQRQLAFDRQRHFDETVRPLLNAAIHLPIATFIALGARLLFFGLW